MIDYSYMDAVYESPRQLAEFLGAVVEESGISWFIATGFKKGKYASKFIELLLENGHNCKAPYTRGGICSEEKHHVVRFQ